MSNPGLFGIGLLAYASWQTILFLNDRGSRVWARQRYHRYVPRPTADSAKKNRRCLNCASYSPHPDFLRSGMCGHPEWKAAMGSPEVMVRKDAHCELWERGLSS